MEESILKQKDKVDWLKLGDGNKYFFHTYVREKNKHKNMTSLTSLNGENISTKDEITKETMDFYANLVGIAARNLRGIDKTCAMTGKTLSKDDALSLIKQIEEK